MTEPAPIRVLERAVVFARLREMDISSVHVMFHGGGDEGDYDNIEIYYNDKSLADDDDDVLDQEMIDAILQPYYDIEMGFDGCDVSGNIEWRCSTMQVFRHMSTMTWVDLPSEEI